MRVTFLGTGTSVGVPAIGCTCAVCQSTDPRNKRRRSSLFVEAEGQHVLIDTTPDFREQALTYRIPRVDAVCFTHGHADHIFGFDDIRRYNSMQGGSIPAYGSAGTLDDLRRIFDYVGVDEPGGVYRPQIAFVATEGPFRVGDVELTPAPVRHGSKPTQGYRVQAGGCSLGYVPDCHEMPDETVALLAGVDVMILDGLRHRAHSTHLTVAESLGLLAQIGAKSSYLIHMCHDLDHSTTEAQLPEGVRLSYDGLVLAW